MRVTMMLADAAQEVNGKLYVLGGGWSITGPTPPPMAIALKLDVPWTDAGKLHDFRLVLVDADGHQVVAPAGDGVEASGQFEVARPPGLPAGTDIDLALAVTIGPLPLAPGRYAWQLWVDGETHVDWQRPFQVRE
jgi:hypothetical protein